MFIKQKRKCLTSAECYKNARKVGAGCSAVHNIAFLVTDKGWKEK